MVAGDIGLALEILADVNRTVLQRVHAEPQNWWLVRDVAELWRQAHIKRQLRDAETAILAPLGLTSESFIARQRELAPSVTERLTAALRGFELNGIEVIFCGIDPEGAHLYQADGANVVSRDTTGIASIGSGSYHARSELRVSGHTPDTPFALALYHTYVAKKRAEVAPGVGTDTDTFLAWGLGGTSNIRPDLIAAIDKAFQKSVKQAKAVASKIEIEVQSKVAQMLTPPVQPEQEARAGLDGSVVPLAVPDPAHEGDVPVVKPNPGR